MGSVRWSLFWLYRSLLNLTTRGGCRPTAKLCNASSTRAAWTKPHLAKPLCENDDSVVTVAFLGQKKRGQPLCVRPTAFFGQSIRDSLSMYGCPRCILCHWRC